MISFDGRYTREQLGQGLRLAWHPRGRSLILRLLAAVLVIGGLAFVVYGLVTGELGLGQVARTLLLLVVIGLWIVAPYFNAWQTARRSWRDSEGVLRLGGTVSKEGIVLERDGKRVEQAWEAFVRAYLQEDLVVLVSVDRTTTILPRDFFADEGDWQGVRQMVEFNVVSPS